MSTRTKKPAPVAEVPQVEANGHAEATAPAAPAAKKRPACPISRSQFRAKAMPIMASFGDAKVILAVKEFSTGSLGWYAQGKVTLTVDGVPVEAQVGFNLTLVHSKELPAE